MKHDGTNGDGSGESGEPPRPEIDPALARSLLGGDDAPAADAGDAPWEQVAEVLQDVPDDAEEAGADRPAAVPVADVVEEVPPPTTDDEPATDDEPDTDEEPDDDPDLEALLGVPLPARVEALLFAATEPLSLARLRSLTATDDPAELRRALDGLETSYRERGSALHLVELGGGFVLRTTPDVAPAVARLGRRRDQERLSTAALETLAIVAYRQPVLRVDVEKIRGVASGEVLRSLVEKGLVRVAGRADLPGNPLLYGTTQRFLELFGLRNLRDLPSDEQLLRKPG